MGLDEGLGNGQTQAGPAATPVLAEHLEDALAFRSRNAGSVVRDGNLDQRLGGRSDQLGAD